jgi:hypothetical protein
VTDLGDRCIECGHDTSFGSGRFVNRIPADNGTASGWLCPDCQQENCDRCNQPDTDFLIGDDGQVVCSRCWDDD